MLNHTYTSVKNANLVDCGKKQHISSQPSPLLKDNFLGEFRTELDRKKVLANLGIITDVSLEWQFIKGSIESSDTLTSYIENKTTYKSILGEYKDKVVSLIKGIQQLESKINTEDELEQNQNNRLTSLEKNLGQVEKDITSLQEFLDSVEGIDFKDLQKKLDNITANIESINSLIAISSEEGNALTQKSDGLYVADLSKEVNKIADLSIQVQTISENYITKSDLGTGPYDFVPTSTFDTYTTTVNKAIDSIRSELGNTIKTGSDGNVNKLSVNTITKSTDGNIKIDLGLERTSNVPLDIYGVVKDLSDLYALNPAICYAGMSVIVSSQSALYILRDPGEEGITEDYIKDSDSWKCPEDLVTQAVTVTEYEDLVREDSIADHIFYYVYEPKAQEEPNPDDFGGKDSAEYKEAHDLWLKYLGNHYMSAVWARQIEKSLADKAPISMFGNFDVQLDELRELINNTTGPNKEINLTGLNTQIQTNSTNIAKLEEQDITLAGNIASLRTSLDDYVKESDIFKDNKYIFASQDAFDAYTTNQQQEIDTQKVTTVEVQLNSTPITIKNSQLEVNNIPVAFTKDIPKIEVMSENDFNPETAKDDTYYYLYDTDESYITTSEFDQYKSTQSALITNINSLIGSSSLPENTTSLTDAIAKLSDQVKQLQAIINSSQ